MKPFSLHFLRAVLFFGFIQVSEAQDNRNYVNPSDTNLKIDFRYDNPARAAYHIGANVGVDVSTFSGGVYAEVTGSYSPKRFAFSGSYAFDLSNSDFISKSNLLNYGNKYSNLKVAAAFNFKDETTKANVQPSVGIDVLSSTNDGFTTTTKSYVYKTDYEVSTRKTKGVGFSFNSFSSNTFYDKSKVDTTAAFITLENNAAVPAAFILPFQAAMFGLSLQLNEFQSYKTYFQYENLRRLKLKSNYFKTATIELLFAPTVGNGEFIYAQNASGGVDQFKVADVQKRRFGFRLVASTNQFKKIMTKPGLYLNGEMGMRPGIYPKKAGDPETNQFVTNLLSNPFYMKIGIGFMF